MPAARSVLYFARYWLARPPRNSTWMPKREANRGIMSVRITGSGDPATTTLPSFVAARISFHSFSQPFCWAEAVLTQNKTKRITLSMAYLLYLTAITPADAGRAKFLAPVVVFTSEAETPRRAGNRNPRLEIPFCCPQAERES